MTRRENGISDRDQFGAVRVVCDQPADDPGESGVAGAVANHHGAGSRDTQFRHHLDRRQVLPGVVDMQIDSSRERPIHDGDMVTAARADAAMTDGA